MVKRGARPPAGPNKPPRRWAGPDIPVVDVSRLQVSEGLFTDEILAQGSAAEVRRELELLGTAIKHGAWGSSDGNGPTKVAEWLGEALEAIGRGVSPSSALGLAAASRRKPLSLKRAQQQVFDDLRSQNVPVKRAHMLIGLLREDAEGNFYFKKLSAAGRESAAAAVKTRFGLAKNREQLKPVKYSSK